MLLVTLYEFIGFYWYWMESTSTKVRGSSSIFWPILRPLSFRTKIYTLHLQALLPIDGQNLSAALRESKTKLGPWQVEYFFLDSLGCDQENQCMVLSGIKQQSSGDLFDLLSTTIWFWVSQMTISILDDESLDFGETYFQTKPKIKAVFKTRRPFVLVGWERNSSNELW